METLVLMFFNTERNKQTNKKTNNITNLYAGRMNTEAEDYTLLLGWEVGCSESMSLACSAYEYYSLLVKYKKCISYSRTKMNTTFHITFVNIIQTIHAHPPHTHTHIYTAKYIKRYMHFILLVICMNDNHFITLTRLWTKWPSYNCVHRSTNSVVMLHAYASCHAYISYQWTLLW